MNFGAMIWTAAAQVPAMDPIGWAFLVGALVGAALVAHRRKASKTRAGLVATAAIVVPLAAAAQLTLPNEFVNGTIADANEVNANFAALLDDNGRFHVSLSGAGGPNEVVVDPTAMVQLCEDEDGCNLILVTAGGATDISNLRLVLSGSAVPREWAGARLGLTGVDGDGVVDQFQNGGSNSLNTGCIVADGSLSSNTDANADFVLRAFAVDVECRLTIED